MPRERGLLGALTRTPGGGADDLRRLRLKGIIKRVPGRHRYQVTSYGRWIATFFTRLVIPTLADLDSISRPPRRVLRPLASAWRAFDKELRTLLRDCDLAA